VYSQVLLQAEGLSSTQQAILLGACFLAVVSVLAVSCRRRRTKVSESADVSTVVATPKDPLETGAGVGVEQPALRRRRSRCDSPRPVAENNENEAPQSNCAMGSAAFLSQLNNFSQEELLSLPGLGEKSVAKIVKYRSKHGEIHEIDELVGKVGLSRVIVTKMAKVHGL
jgi:DNA uptake protein ComE-like DNA-binding protein